ncbi:alpha/beta hydrolase family protein [Paracidovorax cattleyae]|uniref:Predicted dienelactone hydrolase n=1 Tax=Paracidovorax cattleyae TaxID=80868 RepID=A0A1H0WTR3_9BURK|nr:dienelactone hydrolase [Paracidovorax cattleyae]MBF9265531.1 dienelactone hydrolase [Paracidovorax cattleyae]SDP93979.1 Predicted dienelactone hydrolase [Paracidovorax cattleyae]
MTLRHLLCLAALCLSTTLTQAAGPDFIEVPANANGQPQPHHAGIARIEVSADIPFEALVWYPTDAAERSWQIGPFPIPATRNAGVADGKFPVVLLSHGGGPGGGTPLVLRQVSAHLARQGYVVIAPFHGKTGLRGRPMQVKLALDAVLADPRFNPHVDPARLGMLGFSLGGAVTLELAGAVPNQAHFDAYCAAHPNDVMSCVDAPDKGDASAAPKHPSASGEVPPSPQLPLKAIALLDPLAALYPSSGLQTVTMPVLLFRPQQSQLSGDGNAAGLAAALPHAPQYQTLPGGHFVLIDICPPVLQAEAAEVCTDPQGVDRAAVHAAIESTIAAFFGKHL